MAWESDISNLRIKTLTLHILNLAIAKFLKTVFLKILLWQEYAMPQPTDQKILHLNFAILTLADILVRTKLYHRLIYCNSCKVCKGLGYF